MLQTIIDNDAVLTQKFSSLPVISRDVFADFTTIHNKLVGIRGLRGTGKTTFLLTLRKQTPDSIYLSCDQSYRLTYSLFETIKDLYKSYGYTTFFCDEIQEIPNRHQELKQLYDILDVRIRFSGSNMIDITGGGYDLSRRAIVRTMPLFSFREYITITKHITIPRYHMPDILTHHQTIAKEHLHRYTHTQFADYLKRGQFGYAFESQTNLREYQEKLSNSLKKSVYQDMSRFVDISSTNLSKLRELILFLASAGTSDCSIHSLAKKISLSAPTTDVYMQFLTQAGIVHFLPFFGNISDTMRKSKKYTLASPNIISLFADTIGCMRESFFVSSLQSILTPIPHTNLFHQSHTDFVLEYEGQTYFFEIGGKGKKRTTTDPNLFVIKDDIMIGQGNEIPLRLFGLL